MDNQSSRFHLALKVSSQRFADSVAFYQRLFDVAPTKLKPGYAKFEPTTPSVNFTLNQVEHVETDEIDHLGIQVWSESDLTNARSRIVKAGLDVRDEHEVECCYASQNKFWVSDPDGRQVEFFIVLHDVERHGRRPDADVTKPAVENACCTPSTSGECCAGDASPPTSNQACCTS